MVFLSIVYLESLDETKDIVIFKYNKKYIYWEPITYDHSLPGWLFEYP
jgi:hypothetical protein